MLDFLDSLRISFIGEFVEFQELTQDAVYTCLRTDYLDSRTNEEIKGINIIENLT